MAEPAASEVSLRPGGGAPPGLSLRPGAGATMGSFGLMTAPPRAKKEVSIPRSKQTPGAEPLIYSKEFLMNFKDKFVSLPPELQGSTIEIVLVEHAPEQQWERKEQGAPGGGQKNDPRDWRTRTELPAPREERGGGGGGRGGDRRGGGSHRDPRGGGGHRGGPSPMMPAGPGPDIKLAENKWTIGMASDEQTKMLRTVKGILNKITPEKFEKLSDQIVQSGIESAELLRGVISLIFDKAVAEPTFCALYARLCVKLSKALPEFPPLEGEDKPMTFRRILLNTCQEEFEGAEKSRAAVLAELAETPDVTPEEREYKMRKVKLATLGNIRLIGELFKEKMIMERILHACITDLMGKDNKKDVPPEENLEALCNLLMTVGKNLDASPRSKPLVEGYFQKLQNFTKNDKVATRIRFLCKDVIDLRKNKWIPRREKLEAKTIEQVHAEAAAEMGISRPAGGHRGGGGGAPHPHGQYGGDVRSMGNALPGMPGDIDDRFMFPEGPGGPQNDGWEVAGSKKKKAEAQATGQSYSALTGPYVPNANFTKPQDRAPPPKEAAMAPSAAEVKAAEDASKPKLLSAAELSKKLDNLLNEFLSVRDQKEVLLSLEEFSTTGQVADKAKMGTELAKKTLDLIIAKSSEKDCELLVVLMVALVKGSHCTWADLSAPLLEIYSQMEDLAMDVPMAPKLMATACAAFIIEGGLKMDFIKEACLACEDIFARRDSAIPIFKALKAKGPFMKLLMDQKPNVKEYLLDEVAEPEKELKEFLEKEGLGQLNE